MKRFLWLGMVLGLLVLWTACGDVFRPIIIPNPQQFPNPQAAHSVVTLSDNGTVVDGSAMVIDVSGDSDVSQKNVGLHPVHAVQQSAGVVLVVNQSVPGVAQESLTKLGFLGTTIGSVTTATLPTGSAPNFVATTEATRAYVSLPQYVNPGTGGVVPSVAVINTTQNSVVATIAVGNNPIAMAETPDGTKLYVANDSSPGSVSAFNTLDRSSRTVSGSFSSPPIWLSARSDSQRVYVLESSGTIGFLDTTTTSGPDTFTETAISVPGATYMWYDMILNRLYIPGNGQVTILDVSQSTLSSQNILATVAIPTVSHSGTGDPCAGNTAGPLSVRAVTSLPDGSRAYVGSFYIDGADNFCPQVTVITTSNNTIKTGVAIPGFPDATNSSSPYYAPVCATTRFRLNMAAGGDSTRAYLTSCDGGIVDIVDTSTDTYILNVPAPFSVRAPIPPSILNPPQNPVFMIAGP